MTAHNNGSGMVLRQTSNTHIFETTAMYNGRNGIFVIELRHFNIMNKIIHNNGFTTFVDEYSLQVRILLQPKFTNISCILYRNNY